MKNVLAVAFLCLFSLSLAAGQASKTSGVEDEIKKQEQNWAQATLKEGAAAVDQYEADDITDTDPPAEINVGFFRELRGAEVELPCPVDGILGDCWSGS